MANKMAADLRPSAPTAADGRMLVTDFAERIYLQWVQTEKRPATYCGYLKIWKHRLHDHFATTRLCDYQPHHATVYLTSLAKAGLGRETVSHVRGLMSGLFGHALALGHLNANPIRGVRLLVKPKASAGTAHYTLAEMIAILAGLKGVPKARVAMALSFIGLRTSEIAGLRWDDVDFERGVIHVQRSFWRGNITEGGKTNKVRSIPVFGNLLSVLEDYRRLPNVSGFVLENERARPVDLGAFGLTVIRPTLEALGLEWRGYYAGRRGSETEMNGFTNGNSQITSHYFGHTKAIADKHYVKPLPDATRAAALQFDSALGKGQQGTDGAEVTENTRQLVQ